VAAWPGVTRSSITGDKIKPCKGEIREQTAIQIPKLHADVGETGQLGGELK